MNWFCDRFESFDEKEIFRCDVKNAKLRQTISALICERINKLNVETLSTKTSDIIGLLKHQVLKYLEYSSDGWNQCYENQF